MKTVISLLTTMVFVFAFGTAFADDWPTDKKSFKFLGTELRDEVQMAEVIGSGAAAGGVRAEGIDKGTMSEESLFGRPYGDFPSTSGEYYEREIPAGATGAAPGGVREEASQEDKGGRFFDNRPGRDPVTDLPDPYGDY